MRTDQTIQAQTCSVCGRPTSNFGVIGQNERLCMEPPETKHTIWGQLSSAVGTSCFGWLGGYAFTLHDYNKELRKSKQEDKPESDLQIARSVQSFLGNLHQALLTIRECLVRHDEWPLIWELDRVNLLPREGQPWPIVEYDHDPK